MKESRRKQIESLLAERRSISMHELCEALNMSKIGAMGVGGDTTVLGVNIETSGSHKPWLPVAVNINCWPGRKAVCRVYPDGRVEQVGA